MPFFTRVAQFHLASLRQAQLLQLSNLISSCEIEPARVRIVSSAAYNLAMWVHAVQENGQLESVRQWERAELHEIMQKQDVVQVSSACLHCICYIRKHSQTPSQRLIQTSGSTK